MSPKNDRIDTYDSLAVECNDIVLDDLLVPTIPSTWTEDVISDKTAANIINKNNKSVNDGCEITIRLKIYWFSRFLNHRLQQIHVQLPQFNAVQSMKMLSDTIDNVWFADVNVDQTIWNKKTSIPGNLSINFLYETKIGWIRYKEMFSLDDLIDDTIKTCLCIGFIHRLSETESILSSLTDIWHVQSTTDTNYINNSQSADPMLIQQTEEKLLKQMRVSSDSNDDDMKSADRKEMTHLLGVNPDIALCVNFGLRMKNDDKQMKNEKNQIGVNNCTQSDKIASSFDRALSFFNIKSFVLPNDFLLILQMIFEEMENAQNKNDNTMEMIIQYMKQQFIDIFCGFLRYPLYMFTVNDLICLVPCINLVYALNSQLFGENSDQSRTIRDFCDQLKELDFFSTQEATSKTKWILLDALGVDLKIESLFNERYIPMEAMKNLMKYWYLNDDPDLNLIIQCHIGNTTHHKQHSDLGLQQLRINLFSPLMVNDQHITIDKILARYTMTNFERKHFIFVLIAGKTRQEQSLLKQWINSDKNNNDGCINTRLIIPDKDEEAPTALECSIENRYEASVRLLLESENVDFTPRAVIDGYNSKSNNIRNMIISQLMRMSESPINSIKTGRYRQLNLIDLITRKTKTDLECLKILANFINVNMVISNENSPTAKYTSFEAAIKYGCYEFAKILLEKRNVNITCRAMVDGLTSNCTNIQKMMVAKLIEMVECPVQSVQLQQNLLELIQIQSPVYIESLKNFTSIYQLTDFINGRSVLSDKEENDTILETAIKRECEKSAEVLLASKNIDITPQAVVYGYSSKCQSIQKMILSQLINMAKISTEMIQSSRYWKIDICELVKAQSQADVECLKIFASIKELHSYMNKQIIKASEESPERTVLESVIEYKYETSMKILLESENVNISSWAVTNGLNSDNQNVRNIMKSYLVNLFESKQSFTTMQRFDLFELIRRQSRHDLECLEVLANTKEFIKNINATYVVTNDLTQELTPLEMAIQHECEKSAQILFANENVVITPRAVVDGYSSTCINIQQMLISQLVIMSECSTVPTQKKGSCRLDWFVLVNQETETNLECLKMFTRIKEMRNFVNAKLAVSVEDQIHQTLLEIALEYGHYKSAQILIESVDITPDAVIIGINSKNLKIRELVISQLISIFKSKPNFATPQRFDLFALIKRQSTVDLSCLKILTNTQEFIENMNATYVVTNDLTQELTPLEMAIQHECEKSAEILFISNNVVITQRAVIDGYNNKCNNIKKMVISQLINMSKCSMDSIRTGRYYPLHLVDMITRQTQTDFECLKIFIDVEELTDFINTYLMISNTNKHESIFTPFQAAIKRANGYHEFAAMLLEKSTMDITPDIVVDAFRSNNPKIQKMMVGRLSEIAKSPIKSVQLQHHLVECIRQQTPVDIEYLKIFTSNYQILIDTINGRLVTGDDAGLTILEVAIKHAYEKSVEILLKSDDVYVTPRVVIDGYSNTKIRKMIKSQLVKMGKIPIESLQHSKYSPLDVFGLIKHRTPTNDQCLKILASIKELKNLINASYEKGKNFLRPLEFAIKHGYCKSATMLLSNKNVDITVYAVIEANNTRDFNYPHWQNMWEMLMLQLQDMSKRRSISMGKYREIGVFELITKMTKPALDCLHILSLIQDVQLVDFMCRDRNVQDYKLLGENIVKLLMKEDEKYGNNDSLHDMLIQLLQSKLIHLTYAAVVAISANSSKKVFSGVVKNYTSSKHNTLTTNVAKYLTNKNGRTPVTEALQKGFHDVFHTMCRFTNAEVTMGDVIEACCTNDVLFASSLAGFMRYNKIVNLKLLDRLIDWDALKKKSVGKCYSALLRDILKNKSKKDDWIYIAIRLDYNLDKAITEAKRIPNLMIKLDVENKDKKNIKLERKHFRKKSSKIHDWYPDKVLGNGAFAEVIMGIDNETTKRVALKFIDISIKNDSAKGNNDYNVSKRNRLITFIAGEISNIQKINHENVIRLLAFNLNVNEKLCWYLNMQLIEIYAK